MKKEMINNILASKRLYLILFLFLGIANNMNAQDYIKIVNKRGVFAKVIEQNEEFIVYESQKTKFSIPKEEVVLIEYLEMGVVYYNEEFIQKLDPTNFHDLPYSRGNCIYVPFASNKVAQRSGAIKLRELLSKDGYWKIVDCEEEAHCILEYVFSDSGRDHAYFIIKDRNGEVLYKSYRVSASGFVPSHVGQESATALYERHISKLKKTNNNEGSGKVL